LTFGVTLLEGEMWVAVTLTSCLVKCFTNLETRLKHIGVCSFSSTKTRSPSYFKLVCHRSRTNLSRHFYFNRVCRLWNALPPVDLNLSFDILKIKIKSFLPFFIKKNNSHIPAIMICFSYLQRNQMP